MLRASFLALFAAPVCFRSFTTMTFQHKSITDLGYGFNSVGELRQIDEETNKLTDLPFQFHLTDNHSENQKHYELLGDAITEYVYGLLKSEGLIQLPLPKNAAPDEVKSFIYATEDALTNPEKLIVLIHGSGVVRAGQWARSIIINTNIEAGTQLQYISKCRSLGYGVIVMNTNDNQRTVDDRNFLIPRSSTPEEHAISVWSDYVKNAKAKFIGIVAHSYGGVVTLRLAHAFPDFFDRVRAIAMTDSVHSFRREAASSNVEVILRHIGRNWVSSHDILDVPQKAPEYEIPRFSAGHPKHEMTSHSAFASVMRFFEARWNQCR